MIIREAKLEDLLSIAKVQIESNRSTYKGIMPHEYLSNLSYESISKVWNDKLFSENRKEFLYVAETDTAGVVGFISGSLEKTDKLFEREITSLYIIKEFQRKCIGKLLIKAIIAKYVEQGVRSIILWTLEDNSSRLFYEYLGGRIVNKRVILRGCKELQQIAYAWENIACLLWF